MGRAYRIWLPMAMVLAAHSVAAQRIAPHATVVYAVGAEPTLPVPILAANEAANVDVSDQLFLHLATFGPGGTVTGDHALVPSLARSWRRVDPLTLIFEIDPRARWQDGAPVTAHDVIYTWRLINEPRLGADQARFESVASVDSIDPRSIRVRFKRPSPEQVYVFGFLVQPVPAHLLERMAPTAIATSSYMSHPIGDGPFRFERRVPGQFVELRADTTFFLGRPTIDRLLFRYVEDPAARLNLFLTGETDVLDNIPLPALAQVRADRSARLVDVASNDLLYFLFNTRSPADTSKPNPLFSDLRVRQALALALDRTTMAQTAFGPTARAADAAESQLWNWITPGQSPARPADLPRARALLRQAGWRDSDGDGIVDKGGVPLRFTVLYPASSDVRHTMAVQAQQMWRAVGVDAELDRAEGPVIGARLPTGRWDVLINRVGQDMTPSSLVQSWSCEAAHRPGSTNYGRWCDTTFDRLTGIAVTARDQVGAWRAVLTRMASLWPAIFLAPGNQIAVHRRFDNVTIWPSHPWLSLWRWRVPASAALPRDR